MATKEQMQAWMRGSPNTPYGTAPGAAKKRVAKKAAEKTPEESKAEVGDKLKHSEDTRFWRDVASPNGTYAVSPAGDDALLKFGKCHGQRVSELVTDRPGRGYLKWISTSGNFDGQLLEIVNKTRERWASTA